MAIAGRAAHESDESLGARARTGDKDAFAALYERHHAAIYDFAVRILRDRDAAADVVQNTFTRAWPALRDGDVPRSVKAWLFGIARNLSIDELRRRRRVFPNEGLGLGLAELEDVDAFDPSEVVETKELAELVWTSAAGLRAEDYALLDLHVRRGLGADELAENLGVRRGAIYTRLTRLRAALEQAVATSLLLRHGRGRCSELDRLASEHRVDASTREVRRMFQSHVDGCARCQESKGLYASPAQILAGLALIPPPDRLADVAWALAGASAAGAGAVAAAADGGGSGGVSAAGVGAFPVTAGVGGGLAVLATVVALGVWAGGGEDGTTAARAQSRSPAERPAPPSPPVLPGGQARSTPAAPPRRRTDTAARQPSPEARAPRRATGGERPALARSARRSAAPSPPPSPPSGARPPSPSPPRRSSPPTPPDPPSPPRPPAPAPPPPPAPRGPRPASPPPPPAAPAPPSVEAEEKAAVCHDGNTLVIGRSAVPAHLAHGDSLGACDVDGEPSP